MFYSQQSIGIEFREHQLKLVHLGKAFHGVKLLNYLCLPLPAEGIFAPDSQEAVAAQLREFVEQRGIKTDEVVIGLPPNEVALREIELPAVEREELPQMLEYEMERHFPFNPREVYVDFLIASRGEEFQNLVLFAARKDRVDQYLALLHQAGLKCVAVDITPLAVINLLQANGVIGDGSNGSRLKDYLLVELGASAIELSLIKSGQLVIARRCCLAENGFLKDPEPPNPCSELSTLELEDRTRGLVQRIACEIARWQRALSHKAGEAWVEHIFVLAQDEIGEPICHQLTEQTQIQASIPNNWPVIKSAIAPPPRFVELAAGLGLALRGVAPHPEVINLLPPLQRQPAKKGRLVVSIGLLILVALLGATNLVSLLLKDRLALARVKQQMELLEPKLAAVNKLEDEYKSLQLPVDTLRQVKPREVTILDVLKEITLRLPAEAWLERMKLEENTLEISGRATSASNLIPLLEASPLFKNVQFTSTITSREGEKEKFKIKLTLEGRAARESFNP